MSRFSLYSFFNFLFLPFFLYLYSQTYFDKAQV